MIQTAVCNDCYVYRDNCPYVNLLLLQKDHCSQNAVMGSQLHCPYIECRYKEKSDRVLCSLAQMLLVGDPNPAQIKPGLECDALSASAPK